MNVIITGANGQLGRELVRTCPRQHTLYGLDQPDFDLCDQLALVRVLGEVEPDLVINAAAYTSVDQAESNPNDAAAVNKDAVWVLAAETRVRNIKLIHLSTDFVFDGRQGRPYRPQDRPEPLNVYGRTKRAGEEAVLKKGDAGALVVRTAWLYSMYGRNFVKTMFKLFKTKNEVRVVADQVGTPTWAHGLAQALWKAAHLEMDGMHHWTDAGVASWYDLAVAVYEEAAGLGMIDREVSIVPLSTEEYPTPAKRPRYTVLDKSETWAQLGTRADHWRTALRHMLADWRDYEKESGS
jgi:dTDP-4-dehydrorhamnose reductase